MCPLGENTPREPSIKFNLPKTPQAFRFISAFYSEHLEPSYNMFCIIAELLNHKGIPSSKKCIYCRECKNAVLCIKRRYTRNWAILDQKRILVKLWFFSLLWMVLSISEVIWNLTFDCAFFFALLAQNGGNVGVLSSHLNLHDLFLLMPFPILSSRAKHFVFHSILFILCFLGTHFKLTKLFDIW